MSTRKLTGREVTALGFPASAIILQSTSVMDSLNVPANGVTVRPENQSRLAALLKEVISLVPLLEAHRKGQAAGAVTNKERVIKAAPERSTDERIHPCVERAQKEKAFTDSELGQHISGKNPTPNTAGTYDAIEGLAAKPTQDSIKGLDRIKGTKGILPVGGGSEPKHNGKVRSKPKYGKDDPINVGGHRKPDKQNTRPDQNEEDDEVATMFAANGVTVNDPSPWRFNSGAHERPEASPIDTVKANNELRLRDREQRVNPTTMFPIGGGRFISSLNLHKLEEIDKERNELQRQHDELAAINPEAASKKYGAALRSLAISARSLFVDCNGNPFPVGGA